MRVVSLVPSLTESIASVDPALLVGVTDWCTHPAGLAARRVRGTKNPDVAAIVELRPDVVIANREENRRLDVERLEAAGVRVWVSRIDTLAEAFAELHVLFADVLGRPAPGWLADAEGAWAARPAVPEADRPRVAVPIWRDPWMVVGSASFPHDVLAHLGLANAFGDRPRYPHVTLDELRSARATVLLPDEPYPFTGADAAECLPGVPTRLVDGRLLFWYGPSLVAAARLDPLAPQV